MRYRLATLDDADPLARLRWDFRAEDGERPAVSAEDFHARYTAFLAQGLASGQWAHWVAEDGGEVVAHMAVLTIVSVPRPSRRRDAWGYLTDCYTRPAHRNRGVGSALLDRVKAWAAERDLELLIVSPSERSVPSVHFHVDVLVRRRRRRSTPARASAPTTSSGCCTCATTTRPSGRSDDVGHTIQAFIAREEVLRAAANHLRHAHVASLAQGLALVPVTDELHDEVTEPGSAAAHEGRLWKLSDALASLAAEWSRRGPVAYVETEYFGGIGDQAALVWEGGEVVYGPERAEIGPINEALSRLGAERGGHLDLFEAVGLRRHRHTGDWIEEAPG